MKAKLIAIGMAAVCISLLFTACGSNTGDDMTTERADTTSSTAAMTTAGDNMTPTVEESDSAR